MFFKSDGHLMIVVDMVSIPNANIGDNADVAPAIAAHQVNGNLVQQQQQQHPHHHHHQPGLYHHQPQIDGAQINGLGPPPDLVVRPGAANADLYARAGGGGHGGIPVGVAGQVYYQPVAAAGIHQHCAGAVGGQAAAMQHSHAAAAVGCQVCGAGLPPVVGASGSGGRRIVPWLPGSSRQNPPMMAPSVGLHAAAAPAAAPAVVYGGADGVLAEADLMPAPRQRRGESSSMMDPLPDLINTHRIPPAGQVQQPPPHHHRHFYQPHNGNLQQQPAPFPGQQRGNGGGAEMMMLYDDPGSCWLSQCSAYRNGNPFAQYVSTAGMAATFGQPNYQRADDGKSALTAAVFQLSGVLEF
jgi:hypothetical protein